MRVYSLVTHLLGAGHLTRAAAIGRAFARAGHEVTLVSGGVPSPLIRTRGLRFVQLPPVRADGTDFGMLLDEEGSPVSATLLAARRGLALEALRTARPDLVLTELFPFGRRVLADEFRTVLEAARALEPRPLIAASVRDILATRKKPARIEEAHRRLRDGYDLVLVHGDPALVRLDETWPLDPHAEGLVRYTGYVDEGRASPIGAAAPEGEVLVSGGSSGESLPLYCAAVGAARLLPHLSWRILLGRGVPEPALAGLARAAPGNAVVERARPDFRALLGRAALSISQAGYNTVVDLLRTGVPAVLVPFEGGTETEQRLRAERLRARGWASVIPEAELSPESLARAVAATLDRPRPEGRPAVDLAGAERTVAIASEELARKRASCAFQTVRRVGVDWAPLEAALRAAAERGRPVAFWWRDDDAVAATPALDRLLSLSARHRAPLAIAAIPAGIHPSLPARLQAEPSTSILVHGLAHRNHAPRGAAKAEFGPTRARDAARRDAAEALARARAAFGTRLLPVFVPPWNRMAPDLAPMLRSAGYGALSAFAGTNGAAPSGPLPRVDAHLDPIDWRGSRGLADPDGLIARLAEAVRGRLATGGSEPIGLLTHHLVHDEEVWTFCAELLERLSRSPAAVLVAIEGLVRTFGERSYEFDAAAS